MTDVGSIIYDKDATFLEVGGTSKDSLQQYGIDDRRAPLLQELKGIRVEPEHAEDDVLQLFKDAPLVSASSEGFVGDIPIWESHFLLSFPQRKYPFSRGGHE